MKLNKRLCRTYANPNWKIPVNNGLIYAEQIKYIIRTAIKNIGGQRILVLFVYLREDLKNAKSQPHWTLFQGRKEYITLEQKNDDTSGWRTAAFENLDERYCSYSKYAFFTPADEERIIRFCKNTGTSGLSCLDMLQRNIMSKQRNKKKIKQEKVILSKMKTVPALPRDLKRHIHQEIMPGYIFYDYERNKKHLKGHCTICNNIVLVPEAKHNQKGICPSCKKVITFKSNGRLGYLFDQNTIQIIQKVSENELVVRYIKAYYSYRKSEPAYEHVYENARIFLHWDNQGQITTQNYHLDYRNAILTPWKRGFYPVYNKWQYNFEADCCGYLYSKNLGVELYETPWQYSQLKDYYAADPIPLYVPQYLQRYVQYPMLEYLVKLRLYNLVTDIVYQGNYDYSTPPVNLRGKNLREILGIEKIHLPLLQNINPGGKLLGLIKSLIANNVALNENMLSWCSHHGIGQAEYLTIPLQYMTPHRLIQYVEKQFENPPRTSKYTNDGYSSMNSVLSDYRDYLNMCEDLKFDLNNTFVLFPGRLKRAHDKVNELFDKHKALIYDQLIRQQFPALDKQYRFKKNGYVIMPPHSAQELIDEGHNLHHCVASYVKSVAKEKCTILFVRKTDNLGKSLCTVELRDNEVVQARIFGNNPAPPEIKKFIDIWKRKILHTPALSRAA